MGAIGGLLGIGGGQSGTGIQGAQSANITNPIGNPYQIQNAYSGNQTALGNQASLLAALQAQNGLANQSNVYNQLQGIASGTGPNPAQAALNQNTATNVANQAALMAGQRGAASNVGLIARQAAQQGAATQQQAVGQGATLQAQQELNAIQQAGGIAGQQASNQIGATTANTQAQQSEQQNLLNALQGYNSNQVAMQSNINAANAGLANTQLQGQQGLIGGVLNGAGAILGSARGGEVPHYDDGGEVSDTDPSPPQFTQKAKSGPNLASAAPILIAAMADGGGVDSTATPQDPAGPQSSFGKFLSKWQKGNSSNPNQSSGPFNMAGNPGSSQLQQGVSNLGIGIGKALASKPSNTGSPDVDPGIGGGSDGGAGGADTVAQQPPGGMIQGGAAGAAFAKGGKVPALLSPGEIYLSPKAVEAVRKGADPMKVGEKIPGKPKVGGAKNSYANDTVKKNLDEGGIVVPRSETKSKNPDRNSRDFVSKVISKRKAKR